MATVLMRMLSTLKAASLNRVVLYMEITNCEDTTFLVDSPFM